MPKGRLIFPFVATFQLLDTEATKTNPPPGFTSGYDKEFEEPVVYDSDGDGIGELHRIEVPAVVECQIQARDWETLQQITSGRSTTGEIEITLFRHELEQKGLLKVNGFPKIHENDRLEKIESVDGKLILEFVSPHKLYVVETRTESFMSNGPNLIAVVLQSRVEGLDI
jgi:hypothetical protein